MRVIATHSGTDSQVGTVLGAFSPADGQRPGGIR